MGVLNADLSLNEDSWEKAKPLLLTPYLWVRRSPSRIMLKGTPQRDLIWPEFCGAFRCDNARHHLAPFGHPTG